MNKSVRRILSELFLELQTQKYVGQSADAQYDI